MFREMKTKQFNINCVDFKLCGYDSLTFTLGLTQLKNKSIFLLQSKIPPQSTGRVFKFKTTSTDTFRRVHYYTLASTFLVSFLHKLRYPWKITQGKKANY